MRGWWARLISDPARRSTCPWLTPASTRRPAAIASLVGLCDRRAVQPAHPAHLGASAAGGTQPDRPGARLLTSATRLWQDRSWAQIRWPRRRCSGASAAPAPSVLAWALAALNYGYQTQASSLVGVVAIEAPPWARWWPGGNRLDKATTADPAGHRPGAGDRDELDHQCLGRSAPS